MSKLVQESVPRTLFKMAFPMLAGTFAMNAYSLTDTWFVSQLGTDPLAAMGFTVPVVMILACLAMGLGAGVTALVSHALGQRDHEKAARITTHGALLVLLLSLVLCVAGLLTIEPVFTMLNAKPELVPLIGEYMNVWYLGLIFMTIPMLGNGILISCGDSKSAARLMMIGTILNTILDPIFIFLLDMGLQGAAIATVIGQMVSTAWVLRQLIKKHRLLNYQGKILLDFVDSLRSIVRLGFPSILSQIMMPISMTFMTAIIGGYGKKAVAAIGTAGRLEMFAFVIPMALGISLAPFVSQNLGAGRIDRVKQAIKLSSVFAVCYGAFIAVVFYLFAPQLASIFSDDPEVVEVLVRYIRIIAFGYGLMEVHRYSGIILMGLHKASNSMLINGIRVFILMIPLVLIGEWLYGLDGVFYGRLVCDLLAGGVGLLWVLRVCNTLLVSEGAVSRDNVVKESPEEIAMIETGEEMATQESARYVVGYHEEFDENE